MPTPSLDSVSMGVWRFTLDAGSQVQELRVNANYVLTCGEASVMGGQDFNAWPLLTEGQRQQLQLVVNKVLTEVGKL